MAEQNLHRHPGPLTLQLRWFTRLRWIAGACAVIGAVIDRFWLKLIPQSNGIFAVGLAILIYNLVLYGSLDVISGRPRRKRSLLMLAWAQLLLDFAALPLLVTWTGGLRSALVGFFVFHMVFASLLLPRRMAYACAAAAVAILASALALAGQIPVDPRERLFGLTQVFILFMLVFLANRITQSLRRQWRKLERQNRRIRKMSRDLRRQQRALIQHEKMVALGQMAAGVTHEIANPLASMDSLLQLMQRKPEKLRPDAIATLREQAARIAQIIQQMKAFAHPTESEQQILPLNDVVQKALGMLRFDPRMRRVAVVLDLPPDVGSVPVMPQALEQVLLNLVTNSLDAMAEVPEPKLSIRTAHRHGECRIEVSDNGHGIRAEHMKRLFEPFFTTKPIGKGTGLGLSISYSLIRRQRGHISVHSEVGKGTTFTIHLVDDQKASQIWEHGRPTAVAYGK